METTFPGQRFTKEEEKEINRERLREYIKLCGDYSDLWNEFLSNEDKNSSISLPPGPLKVLPKTTQSCIERGYCYHREYMTNDTSQSKRRPVPTIKDSVNCWVIYNACLATNDLSYSVFAAAQNLGFREPQDMLQVLSLRLLHTESCPVSVYGIFAVRDDTEPLRNYVFNRTRDDPVMIQQDSSALPLCSPCRGMYVLDRALLEVDLWMKKEGDVSTDEKLLSAYIEIDIGACLDEKLIGRIYGDRCMLDMSYIFLTASVEATIQVSALVDNPYHVKFVAFSSCFDDDNEIILFKGKGIKKGELIQHVVALKEGGKLAVRLEFGNSVFEWSFQNEAVGMSSSPDECKNQFDVRVFFAPKNQAAVTSRYHEWKRKCKNKCKTSIAGFAE